MMNRRADAESVLLVPVPEVTHILQPYRSRHKPPDEGGMVEHISLHFPFLAPAQLDGALASLEVFISGHPSFPYELRQTAWFDEQGILYLSPEPADVFVDITHQLSDLFGVTPYGGLYEDVTPHLTVGYHCAQDSLERLAQDLQEDLPIAAMAREVWAMVGCPESGWELHARFPFGSHAAARLGASG